MCVCVANGKEATEVRLLLDGLSKTIERPVRDIETPAYSLSVSGAIPLCQPAHCTVSFEYRTALEVFPLRYSNP